LKKRKIDILYISKRLDSFAKVKKVRYFLAYFGNILFINGSTGRVRIIAPTRPKEATRLELSL
jgi:hypothetical protein